MDGDLTEPKLSESERWQRDIGSADISYEAETPDELRRSYQTNVDSGPRLTVYEIDSPRAGTGLTDIFQAVSGMRDGHAQTVRDATLRTLQSRNTSIPVALATEGSIGDVNDPNLLENNDVVAFSMGGDSYIETDDNENITDTISYGFATAEVISVRLAEARDDSAIILQSAGNGGDNVVLPNGLERQIASTGTIHSYLMKVGAVKADEQGRLNMEAYSSRNGPSFVSAIPENMRYLEPGENNNLTTDVIRNYTDTTAYEATATAGTITPMSTMEQMSYLEDEFRNGGQDLKALKRIEAEAENGSVYSTIRVIAEVAAESEAAARQERNTAIARTPGASVEGTSFTAPVAAGLMAEAQQNTPDLTNYEYMSAMRIAARPFIGARGDNDGNSYATTGNDRLWSPVSGFGYMDPAKLNDRVLPEMARLREGGATSTEKNLATEEMAYAEPSSVENGRNIYEIPVTDSATILSQTFAMQFEGRRIPPEVEIVAPNGQSIRLAPSRSFDDDGARVARNSLLTTDAHFGADSRGVWKISVPEGFEMQSVQGFMNGVERGGVIDQTIAAFPQERPSVLQINPDLSATPVDSSPARSLVREQNMTTSQNMVSVPGM